MFVKCDSDVRKNTLNVRKMRLLNVRKNTLNVRKNTLNVRKMRPLNVRKMQL